MKNLILTNAFIVLSFLKVGAQTVDEIVSKNLNAIGGVEKLNKVKSVKMESLIKVQGLEIGNQTVIIVGKALRSDSKIMGNAMIQAFDGNKAWEVTPIMMGGSGEAKQMTEEMTKSIITQTDPFPLLNYDKKGTKLELLASERVKERNTYHLKISPNGGAESEIWIDEASGLTSKLKTVQNGLEVEIFFSNYTAIEGINFAMTMEILNPLAGSINSDTKTVVLNPTIDEVIFNMPNSKN